MPFDDWFATITGFQPHPWQSQVGAEARCRDRQLRVPTGFGKTAGTVLPWLYHRKVRGDASWPNRLVFCLPMRVLVEQTEAAIKGWLEKAGLDVPVVVLLGGRHESSWLERVDQPTILVGTQDMLLSRALGRGYGSSRGLWPMEMGLLHRDALWVIDEVQLMDVGLATTTQLHGFRHADQSQGRPELRPTFCWWMSATFQESWMKSIDFEPCLASVTSTRIGPSLREGGLWAVKKHLSVRGDVGTPEEVAAVAGSLHEPGKTTLIIVNTVDRARKVHETLAKKKLDAELVHSRFRGAERRGWSFLQRGYPVPDAGRIIVATQVVEAGVDISAATLVTDLAPWSSLVQRFGRCARYEGEEGRIIVAGAPSDEKKKAAPYSLEAITAAAKAIGLLGDDAGPACLEAFEERLASEDGDLLRELYPYAPLHVLRRHDFDDLFDTTPDLSGADLDVGRFIRSGDERDVSVFWREIDQGARELEVDPPAREELCPVPIGELEAFLQQKHRGFVKDYLTGKWRRLDRLVPGMTVLLAASAGGYDVRRGWDPKATGPVVPASSTDSPTALELASGAADDDALSANPWKTIRTHGREAGVEARRLAEALGLPGLLAGILDLVGRWHDAGKAHPVFQDAIVDAARASAGVLAARRDLAKAPKGAWHRPAYPERPGFRHELASTLLMLELLHRAMPEHEGLLGSKRELLGALGIPLHLPDVAQRLPDDVLTRELVQLSADDLDLALYLVCAHHGKVRTSWSTTPNDQAAGHGGIHGVVEGDAVASFAVSTASGTAMNVPTLELSLASAAIGVNARYGSSWNDRVANLLRRFGPFTLAFLEGIFRVADWRASQLDTPEAQS